MVTLLFAAGSGASAAMVRLATSSPFGTCAFRLENGALVDVTPRYGVLQRWTSCQGSYVECQILARKGAVYRAVAWALDQGGKEYDWSALTGMAWHRGTLRRRRWKDGLRWSPAELIVAAMAAAGVTMLEDQHRRTRIMPCDLIQSRRLRLIDQRPSD